MSERIPVHHFHHNEEHSGGASGETRSVPAPLIDELCEEIGAEKGSVCVLLIQRDASGRPYTVDTLTPAQAERVLDAVPWVRREALR